MGWRVGWLDVVQAGGRGNRVRGVRGGAAKRVSSVGRGAKDGGIAIKADLDAPLEVVVAVQRRHVLLELEEIGKRSEDGARRSAEALIEAIAEAERGLRVVGRREKRCAANVAERSLRCKSRT